MVGCSRYRNALMGSSRRFNSPSSTIRFENQAPTLLSKLPPEYYAFHPSPRGGQTVQQDSTGHWDLSGSPSHVGVAKLSATQHRLILSLAADHFHRNRPVAVAAWRFFTVSRLKRYVPDHPRSCHLFVTKQAFSPAPIGLRSGHLRKPTFFCSEK